MDNLFQEIRIKDLDKTENRACSLYHCTSWEPGTTNMKMQQNTDTEEQSNILQTKLWPKNKTQYTFIFPTMTEILTDYEDKI